MCEVGVANIHCEPSLPQLCLVGNTMYVCPYMCNVSVGGVCVEWVYVWSGCMCGVGVCVEWVWVVYVWSGCG